MVFNISDIGKRLSTGFDQAKKYAAEKIGTTEEITPLPDDYKALEEKCDFVKSIYEDLCKVHKMMAHADDYSPPVGDQVMGVLGKIQESFHSKQDSSASPSSNSSTSSLSLPNNHLAAGKMAIDASNGISPQDDLSKSLAWYGSLMEKIGDSRLLLSQRIQVKGRRPLRNVIDVLFDQANSSRKSVYKARLALDTIKGKLGFAGFNGGTTSGTNSPLSQRPMSPKRTEELRVAEESFTRSVAEAKRAINACIESDVLISSLRDMIDIHKQHFKQCVEILEGSL